MGTFIHHFFIASVGVGAVELMKLATLHGKLSNKKYQRLIRSSQFWTWLAVLMGASGFLAWAYHAKNPDIGPWDLIIAGISVRTLLHEATAAGVANAQVQLGAPDEDKVSFRDVIL